MIDLIIAHPRNNDYPVWREMVSEYRYRFNKVIVVFTETHDDVDFSNFIKQVMVKDDISFLTSPKVPSGADWRNVATNHALKYSKSEWVWFTEQDFFIKKGFWELLDSEMKNNDVIATYQQDRMHPCNLLVRRSVINQTCLNFGIVPGKLDHFGLIQKDLESQDNKILKMPEKLYRHLNGLSHNFNLIKNGGIPNYEKRAFNMYLNQCLDIDVHLNSKWVKIVIDYFDRL